MRITDKQLEAKVGIVNRLLGNPEGAGYSIPGVVVLSGAYGGTGVHRYVNESGGVTILASSGLALDIIPLRADESGDDDLIHDVCDYCDRALCDGGICEGTALGDSASGLMCVVCEEMGPTFLVLPCPYCNNEGPN